MIQVKVIAFALWARCSRPALAGIRSEGEDGQASAARSRRAAEGRPALRVCLALLLSLAALSDVAADDKLPLSYFTRHDETGTLQISPDGEYYAMTTRFDAAPRLSFLDVATMKRGVAVKVVSTMEIQEFTWVSPTRVVYTLGRRYLHRMVPTGEMAAIDRDGKNQTSLFGWMKSSHPFGGLLNALDDDDRNILANEGARVSLVDTYNATYKGLETLPLTRASVVFDEKNRIRFARGLDNGSSYAVMWG